MIYCCGHHQFFLFKNFKNIIDFDYFYKKNSKTNNFHERIDKFHGRSDGFVSVYLTCLRNLESIVVYHKQHFNAKFVV